MMLHEQHNTLTTTRCAVSVDRRHCVRQYRQVDKLVLLSRRLHRINTGAIGRLQYEDAARVVTLRRLMRLPAARDLRTALAACGIQL